MNPKGLTRLFSFLGILKLLLADKSNYIMKTLNRCHELPHVELHNIDLSKCVLECGYRQNCKGIQFYRKRRTCGILTRTEVSKPLDVCSGYVYIGRNVMNTTNGTCGPYDRSIVKNNNCITECVGLSEHPKVFSKVLMSVNPTVGTKIKLVCAHSLVELSVNCKRNGKFDRLPDCDPYIAKRFSEVYIYTSTNMTDFTSDDIWNAGTLCAYRSKPFTEQPALFYCNSGVKGQYVKIVLGQRNFLELCDVKIYGHLPRPML